MTKRCIHRDDDVNCKDCGLEHTTYCNDYLEKKENSTTQPQGLAYEWSDWTEKNKYIKVTNNQKINQFEAWKKQLLLIS